MKLWPIIYTLAFIMISVAAYELPTGRYAAVMLGTVLVFISGMIYGSEP